MTTEKVFPHWTAENTANFNKAPIRLKQTLYKSELFSDAALARLIDRYPQGAYGLVHTGGQSEKRRWREGRIDGVPGAKVIDMIAAGAQGPMWLNLRHASEIDPGYEEMLQRMFAELDEHVGPLGVIWRSMGILISSPGARVYYHADMPGQALAQIRGKKRVYVYPAEPPYLTPEGLETIALNSMELDVKYEPSFDDHALALDIEPGDMLHWPLNAPHRIDNHDCLNVSITIEYVTPEIRRHQIVTAANGILRRQLGMTPRSTSTSGPGFWAKAVLNAGARRSGLLARGAAKRRPLTFALDQNAPGGMRDLAS